MNKAVLFDMDGVLVDSEPALAIIAAQVFNEIDIPAKPEDFAPYIGTGEDMYLGEVMRKYGFEYDQEIKHEVYDLYITDAIKYASSFPGTQDLLQNLVSKGVKIAVASSADLIKVKANLEVLGFDNFDSVVTGSDIQRKKPFPDIYLLAAKNVGVEPENCFVVEDAIAGIESGNAAGMTTIGFTSAVSKEKMLKAGADYSVEDFAQLAALLESLIEV